MSPAAQSVHAVPRRNCEYKPQQDSFKSNEQDLILVADTVPPVDQEVTNAARRRGHVIRQIRPSLIRENARDRLEKAGSKVLSTNVLDGVDELVDPQIGGMNRSLPCR